MEKIIRFATKPESWDGSWDGSGSGSGSGYGYWSGHDDTHGSGAGAGEGYGDEYGHGYGRGGGEGYGAGAGEGYGYLSGGYGYGAGYGITTFNGHIVVVIDSIQTGIISCSGNIAKGFIINDDLTVSHCYIAKRGNIFAHGETIRDAISALHDKIFINMSVKDKLIEFSKQFNSIDKYPAKLFFDWHYKLTGSCEMGRIAFARDKNIDIENGLYTVSEFVEITKDSYGGDIIKRIRLMMIS